MASQPSDDLVRSPRDTYGETFTADLLEQYKLYVGSAEQVSARRIASSRLLLALNAGFVALYGIEPAGFGQSWWAVPVPLLGIIVCLLWSRIIKSHKDLNRVKFTLIHELRAAFARSTVYMRVAPCRTGTGTAVSCSDRHRAMDSVDIPSAARRSTDRVGAPSGDGHARTAVAIASVATPGRSMHSKSTLQAYGANRPGRLRACPSGTRSPIDTPRH